jgi:hypothetical protein
VYDLVMDVASHDRTIEEIVAGLRRLGALALEEAGRRDETWRPCRTRWCLSA